jgi:hypothetical protein
MNARKRVETAKPKGPRRSGGIEFKLKNQGLKVRSPKGWGTYVIGIGSKNFLGRGAKRAIGPFERKKGEKAAAEDFTP